MVLHDIQDSYTKEAFIKVIEANGRTVTKIVRFTDLDMEMKCNLNETIKVFEQAYDKGHRIHLFEDTIGRKFKITIKQHEEDSRNIVPVKVVLTEGQANDWAMYLAPYDWPDAQAIFSGKKVNEDTAKSIAGTLHSMDLIDGQILKLEYRR